HLYGRSSTSDVQLAELSALNSAKYDLVDKSAQWGYVTRGEGGMSVADADAMLARATSLAGPYKITVSWPAADKLVNTAYTASIAVRSAAGVGVSGAVVTLTGSNVTLSKTSVTTNSGGNATVGFRIPAGTSSTLTITA